MSSEREKNEKSITSQSAEEIVRDCTERCMQESDERGDCRRKQFK